MLGNQLYSAVIAGDQRRVQLLLEHGADPDCGDDSHTPLMQAAGCQSLPIMHMLIAAGADINRRDSNGRTALMHALQIHADFPLLVIDDWIREAHVRRYPGELSLPVTRLLLTTGAEYGGADNNGFTATNYALLAHLNGIELPPELKLDLAHLVCCKTAIAEHAAKLASILTLKYFPRRLLTMALHLAATRGNVRCCALLLEHGADVNGVDIFGHHPLESAAVGLHTSVVQLLTAYGVTQEGLDRALLAACMADSHRWSEAEKSTIAGRRFEMARYLLIQGANPNYRHEYHEAALRQAIVRDEDCELARLLLKSGADLTACNDEGVALFDYVRTDRMKALLQKFDIEPGH